jgi:hypothetical protein
MKAWSLIYRNLDQSNHAATDTGIARIPVMIDVLAESFIDFVKDDDANV